MQSETLSKQLEFLRELDQLKTVVRQSPIQPTVLAFGVALPSTRCARFGAAELQL